MTFVVPLKISSFDILQLYFNYDTINSIITTSKICYPHIYIKRKKIKAHLNLTFVSTLKKILKEDRFDIVHCYHLSTMWICAFFMKSNVKVPLIFTFNQNIKSITDLQEGQLLPGIVNNVTNFGAFVDVGIKESGLIHVSNLSDSFVSDVNEHVSLHQQVIVKVLEVDVPRKRIQLKLYK